MSHKLGVILFISGIIFTFFDGCYYLMVSKEYNYTMVGEVWYYLHPYSLQMIQPIVERYILIILWDPILLTLLQLPFGVFIFVSGSLLLLCHFFSVKLKNRY